MVKTVLLGAGDVGLIPGEGTKISHATAQPKDKNKQS